MTLTHFLLKLLSWHGKTSMQAKSQHITEHSLHNQTGNFKMLKFSKYNEELLSLKIRHGNKPFMISWDICSMSTITSEVWAAGSKIMAACFRHLYRSDFSTPALWKVGCIFFISSFELANMNDKLCWERDTCTCVSLVLYLGDWQNVQLFLMLSTSFEISLKHLNMHTLLTLEIICFQYHKIQSSDHMLRILYSPSR